MQRLDQKDAARRNQQTGPNQLTARKGKGPIRLVLSRFHDPLLYLLLAAGLITGVLKSAVDASVIFGVVLINAVIAFIQESSAWQR